ncbi:CopD family protein [Arsenicibacter rosenii]|uniref:Protoporphyrinogen IX oxidase n=1 Tax=Arsenicibacter rosenii TaxID=1750698 RepID=A0A1S2VIE7_9BACT|nr:CopD family protein [Arsenicibacter rosenii]OIN58512.1 protoporphyrinogen IX oxidase [Arsenicibacter rosenii]
MTFLYFKALHIIFVVTWFAGLFYMPRLFVYVVESAALPESGQTVLRNQLLLMQRRLWYGITWPSAVITLIMGLSTWYNYGATPGWLIWKLCLVAGLYVYHGLTHLIFRQQQTGNLRYSSNQMRIWNEIATIFLFGIVFLVVLKDTLSLLWGLLGLAIFILLLLFSIRFYRTLRLKKQQKRK